MLMRTMLVAGISLLSMVGYSQSHAPVTIAEADAVIQKVDASIRSVLKMKPAKKRVFGPDRPITRAEVVAKLDVLFESYKPHFQYTPRPFRTVQDVIKQYNTDAKTQAVMEKLSRWGFLAPVGPIVTGGETVSITEFADAIGYFMSQTAALTYFADPKWVPNLQPPGAIDG